jgi:hypothetical protein
VITQLISSIAFGLATIVLVIIIATIREAVQMQSDQVTALINAFNAYKTAVDAKLAALPGEITAAVAAATGDDAAAVTALTAQIQAATSAIGTP